MRRTTRAGGSASALNARWRDEVASAQSVLDNDERIRHRTLGWNGALPRRVQAGVASDEGADRRGHDPSESPDSSSRLQAAWPAAGAARHETSHRGRAPWRARLPGEARPVRVGPEPRAHPVPHGNASERPCPRPLGGRDSVTSAGPEGGSATRGSRTTRVAVSRPCRRSSPGCDGNW